LLLAVIVAPAYPYIIEFGLDGQRLILKLRRIPMKTWMKPEVREQEVGLEVTSYLPAEIDVI